MDSVTEKLVELVAEKPVRDPAKLARQQKYYERLKQKGIAKKQPYNIKPISVL